MGVLTHVKKGINVAAMKRALLLLVAALPLFAQQPARDAIGSVVIQRGSGPRPFILVAVDAFSRGGRSDGAVDYLYKFYTATEAPDARFSFEVAHIDDLDGQLVISAPVDNVRITFANRGEEPSVSRNANGATEYVFRDGIGITRAWGPRVNRAQLRRNGPILSIGCGGEEGSGACINDWGDLGGGGGGCDAGGCPATACSVSNGKLTCSATCPAGSCACCNYGGMMTDPSCGCIPARK